MTDKYIENKVAVFISSYCDSKEDIASGIAKYGVMRKSIKLLLEETNMCKVFAFENGAATSQDVVSSYMDPLADSDLVIIIIDNKDNVTGPTQNEISRAKALQKKMIYIFCDEREKQETEVQQQLLTSTKNPRYRIAHEFSDIPFETYRAVINDVISIYLSYCRGRVGLNQSKEEPSNDVMEMSVADAIFIKKDYFKGFPYTKLLLQKEAGVSFGEITASNDEVDNNCACLLGKVIGSQETDSPNFEKIAVDIKQMHRDDMQRLVLLRYEAVKLYINGEVDYCVDKLKECVQLCKNCINIPKWLCNDIALDLRNVEIESDREHNILNYEFEGQKLLDEDKEPFYYPVIDRIVSDFNESIAEHHFRNVIQSPYTVNFGGVDSVLDKATDTFLVAYYYGSITQMIMVKKRAYEYLSGVALEIRSHQTFMFTVRLLLLTGDEKFLKQFLLTYGENTNNINDVDIEKLRVGICKQNIVHRRLMAKILLIKYFGYYYSDGQFEEELSSLERELKKCIKENIACRTLLKPMIEALGENLKRIDTTRKLTFVYSIFESGLNYLYDDCFKILQHMSFENMEEKYQNKYQKFIVDSLSDENIRKNYYLVYAAQSFRQQETIDHTALDEAVEKCTPLFYENTYLLNTTTHTKDKLWEYAKRYVELINKDNETQGKNGAYSGRVINPYATIANIMRNDVIIFSSRQLKEIINSIHGTLYSTSQTIEAKVDAFELLCLLQLEYPRNRQIYSFTKEIEIDWENVSIAQDIFLVKGYSQSNLRLSYNFLKMILQIEEEDDVLRSMVNIQNEEVTSQISALRFLDNVFRYIHVIKWTEIEKNCIFGHILSLSYSENNDVRFYAMSIMIKLINSTLKKLCLERLVEMMDDEPYKTKVGMLNRLKNVEIDDPKISYIFDKGCTDTHFWVREIAKNRRC